MKEEWFRSAPLRSWAALPIQPSWAAWGHEEKIQSKEGGKEGKEQAEHEEWKQQQLSTSQRSLPQQLDILSFSKPLINFSHHSSVTLLLELEFQLAV